jgi:anti-sigma B factor antagonist
MEFIKKKIKDIVIFELSGNIIGGPDALKINQEIIEYIENGEMRFIIDLGNVTVMNSSGLGTLIASLTSIKKSGGELKLAGANEKIASLFVVTKLNTIFELVGSVEEAVSNFGK